MLLEKLAEERQGVPAPIAILAVPASALAGLVTGAVAGNRLAAIGRAGRLGPKGMEKWKRKNFIFGPRNVSKNIKSKIRKEQRRRGEFVDRGALGGTAAGTAVGVDISSKLRRKDSDR